MMRIILAFIIALFIEFLLGFFNISGTLNLIIVYIVVFAILLYPTFYSLYRSKNIDKLEKFIVKRQRYPYYQFMYGVANKNDSFVEEAFTKMQKRPRGKTYQAFIQTLYALYNGNPKEAQKFVDGIQKVVLKNYYETAIAIEKNDLEEAKKLLKRPLKPWMVEALSVDLEKKQENLERALEHAKNALELTRGIQYYSLFRMYQKDFPEYFSK